MDTNELHKEFAPHYGWITSRTFAYKPLEMSVEAQRRAAALLLKRDPELKRLIANHCKKRWAIAVKVSKETLNLRLFDLNDKTRNASRYTGCDGMLFLLTDKNMCLSDPDETCVNEILSGRPFMYAERVLSPAERSEVLELVDELFPSRPPLSSQPFPQARVA